LLSERSPFAVLGDFNVAPTDADVWDITGFSGGKHVTPAERLALAAVHRGRSMCIPARSSARCY